VVSRAIAPTAPLVPAIEAGEAIIGQDVSGLCSRAVPLGVLLEALGTLPLLVLGDDLKGTLGGDCHQMYGGIAHRTVGDLSLEVVGLEVIVAPCTGL
jgi:hypothetical protein